LFKNSTQHEQIVAALATKNKGLTRNEIITKTGLDSNGATTTLLKELVECGFVKQIFPANGQKTKSLYRLIDEYTIFYFKFLKNKQLNNSWQQISNQPTYTIWLGYAFENLCLKHIAPIKKALGINGVITNEYTWSHKGNDTEQGTQIDLVIDRTDNCINLFELKFNNKPYEISKTYADQLQQKIEVFRIQTKTKKNVFLTFLTASGVTKNKYYLSIVTNQLTIEDLFEEVRTLT